MGLKEFFINTLEDVAHTMKAFEKQAQVELENLKRQNILIKNSSLKKALEYSRKSLLLEKLDKPSTTESKKIYQDIETFQELVKAEEISGDYFEIKVNEDSLLSNEDLLYFKINLATLVDKIIENNKLTSNYKQAYEEYKLMQKKLYTKIKNSING